MVDIRHPTVLSSGNGFELTLRRLGSFRLKLFPYFFEFMAFGGNLFARDKLSFTLFIVTNRKETKSTVDTDNMANVFLLEIFNSFSDRNMEIPQTFEFNQFSSTKVIGAIKVFSEMLAFKGTFGSLAECVDGQGLPVIHKTV